MSSIQTIDSLPNNETPRSFADTQYNLVNDKMEGLEEQIQDLYEQDWTYEINSDDSVDKELI